LRLSEKRVIVRPTRIFPGKSRSEIRRNEEVGAGRRRRGGEVHNRPAVVVKIFHGHMPSQLLALGADGFAEGFPRGFEVVRPLVYCVGFRGKALT